MKEGIRIDDAIAHYNFVNSEQIHAGRLERLTRQKLAEAMFPRLHRNSAAEKLSRLANNDSERLNKEEIRTLCEMTGTDSNFLYSIRPMNWEGKPIKRK